MTESIPQIIDLLKDAGEAIMKIYGEAFKVDKKSDQTPVTDADLVSNQIITEGLLQLFPEIPIISEENEIENYTIRKNWTYVWLLDPLDGTKEFINHTDEFSINLALIKNGCPVLTFIYLPVFKSMYFAQKGEGAFQIIDGNKIKLSVSSFELNQKNLRVCVSRSHMDKLTQKNIDNLNDPVLLPIGSALKFLSIAKGEADYYPRMLNIMEWDTAAGQLIIEEAGGSLVDANSNLALTYNKESMYNPWFIAQGNQITQIV